MKLVKRLALIVAAMAMVLSLVACGGDKFPKTYEYTAPRGDAGEEKATLTLEEDGTYKYTYYATDSKDINKIVMNIETTGKYTMDGDTVTMDTMEGEGYYFAGTSQTDFTCTKDNMGMYEMTYAQGSFVFVVDGTEFGPVTE